MPAPFDAVLRRLLRWPERARRHPPLPRQRPPRPPRVARAGRRSRTPLRDLRRRVADHRDHAAAGRRPPGATPRRRLPATGLRRHAQLAPLSRRHAARDARRRRPPRDRLHRGGAALLFQLSAVPRERGGGARRAPRPGRRRRGHVRRQLVRSPGLHRSQCGARAGGGGAAEPGAARSGAARLHRAQHPGPDGGPLPVSRRSCASRRASSPRRRGIVDWVLVYQSRSGRPEDPWLGPDVCDYLRSAGTDGLRAAVLCPIGFVCDHIEVLYDLDREAAAVCAEIGLPMVRADSANDDPRFLDMMADMVLRTIRRHETGRPLPLAAPLSRRPGNGRAPAPRLIRYDGRRTTMRISRFAECGGGERSSGGLHGRSRARGAAGAGAGAAARDLHRARRADRVRQLFDLSPPGRGRALPASQLPRCASACPGAGGGGRVARDAAVETGVDRLSVSRRARPHRRADRDAPALGGRRRARGRPGKAAAAAALHRRLAARPARSRRVDGRALRGAGARPRPVPQLRRAAEPRSRCVGAGHRLPALGARGGAPQSLLPRRDGQRARARRRGSGAGISRRHGRRHGLAAPAAAGSHV